MARQKTYTVDFLSKTVKKNDGEVPQYFVTDSHEAIIPPDEWETVQKEIERRKELGRHYSGGSIFATKLICGDCGGYFGAKVWHSKDKYRTVIWQCNEKFKKGKEKCRTPHITEETIKVGFVAAFNQLFDIRDEVIKNCEEETKRLTDTTAIDSEAAAVLEEIEVVAELTRKCVEKTQKLLRARKNT